MWRKIAVQVEDSYIQSFMNYVNNHSDNITIERDKNLEYDPYFYERKKELTKFVILLRYNLIKTIK